MYSSMEEEECADCDLGHDYEVQNDLGCDDYK